MNKPQALRRNHAWLPLVALAAPIPLACVAPSGVGATDGAGGKAAGGGDNSLAGSNGDGGSQSHPSGGQNGTGGKASGGASTGGGSVGGADVGGSSSGGANQAGTGGDDGSGGSACSGDCPFAVVQISAGYEHSCALSGGGEVKCWGHNALGQLGLEVTTVAGLPPENALDLGEGQRAVSVLAGGDHSCAIFEDRSAKCWGSGRSGSLGTGSTEDIGNDPGEMGSSLVRLDLGDGAKVLSLAGNYHHMCAIVVGGQVKCWGLNNTGQLGQGDIATRGDDPNEMGDKLAAIDLGLGRSASALAAGMEHTCAILDDGSVKCWGDGTYGQLGQGDQFPRGQAASTMGENLPTVDLGTGRSAKAISAGGAHTCVILDDDSVKCWGYNNKGQLGLGDTTSRGIQPGEMGDALPQVQLGTGRTAKSISAGYYHTCALLDDDSVRCWGWGQYGILGQGDEVSRGNMPNQMGDSLPAISLGTGLSPQSVSTGAAHTCVLLNQGAVKCWGVGQYVQLGLPDAANHGDEPGEMGDNLPEVSIW